jgi:hypothetical protein
MESIQGDKEVSSQQGQKMEEAKNHSKIEKMIIWPIFMSGCFYRFWEAASEKVAEHFWRGYDLVDADFEKMRSLTERENQNKIGFYYECV